MSSTEHLIQVKEQLAAKYERLARIASSKPKQKHFRYRSNRFRRQVQQLRRELESAAS